MSLVKSEKYIKSLPSYSKRVMCVLLVLTLLVSQVACSSFSDKAKDTAGTVADKSKEAANSAVSVTAELFSTITAPKDSEQFEDILNNITAQNIAAFVSELKANVDFESMLVKLDSVKTTFAARLSAEDLKITRITNEIEAARAFIDEPEHIMGDIGQKHGEIAERLDVAARNVGRIANGLEPDAIIDTVDRIGSADYIVDGKMVQSKFSNTPQRTLYAIIQSNDVYPGWGKDGTSYYVVPKDQYAIYQQVNSGAKPADMEIYYNDNRLRLTTLENIERDIRDLELRTGRRFNDVVKSSEFNYSEVQLDRASNTLNKLKNSNIEKINAAKTSIIQESEIAKKTAISSCIKTDFIKTGQAGTIGFGVDAVISVGFALYEKVSDGKSIESFTHEDWKEIGIDTLSGGVQGAGIGVGTQLFCICGIPAPIAAAVVVTVFQTTVLSISYAKGEISLDELLSQTLEFCVTSSIIMAGAIIGQKLIPIPIVGAIVGGVSIGIIVFVVKTYASSIDEIEKKAQEFVDNFTERFNELLGNAGNSLDATVDVTKTTLVTAYKNTQAFISEANTFAVGKVKATFVKSE